MKKLLLAMLLCLLALVACKKEQPPANNNTAANTTTTANPPIVTTPVTSSQVTVSNISPTSGTAGTVITITGTNFKDSATVSFRGINGIVQAVSPTEINVAAPRSFSGAISLTTNNQTVIGPAFTYAVPAMTQISPAAGPTGTIVTLTGTNFGTLLTGVKVLFNNIPGTVKSITNTEIKVEVPVTITGKIDLFLGFQNAIGPELTYTVLPVTPYTSGDVVLKSQLDIDAFVALNKGKQLQITGNLTIFGADIRSVSGLSNIVSVSGTISLSDCPLLSDVSFLNGITAAGGISFINLVASVITMDQLTDLLGSVGVNSCKNLNIFSLKSLRANSSLSGLQITSCEQLSHIDFGSLGSIVNGLGISRTAISDLTGFNLLEKAGSLTLSNNPSLINLHGLERLTSLTLPIATQTTNNLRINGLYITGNPQLNSLTGLQNLTAAPIARINSNATLNDFCPLKAMIINLSILTSSLTRLTLTDNGRYVTTADALAAVKLYN